MPRTTRQTRGAPPARGAQSTLSFNGAATRVTKHTATTGKDLKKAEPAKAKAPKTDIIDLDRADDAAAAVETEVVQEGAKAAPTQAKVSAGSALTPEEVKAERVPHSQVLKYWRAKEAERLAPRGELLLSLPTLVRWRGWLLNNTNLCVVHQEDLTTEEKILRYFDMSSQYGVSCPCLPCY